MEIICQLDAADDFYCRSYCLLNTFRAPLCPSSGAREYYTGGCCLWCLVLWFSSCRYAVELRVMCPVCGLLQQPANRTHNPGRFPAPIHTVPAGRPTSCTLRKGSFPGVKRPGHCVHHSSPSSAEVKEKVDQYYFT